MNFGADVQACTRPLTVFQTFSTSLCGNSNHLCAASLYFLFFLHLWDFFCFFGRATFKRYYLFFCFSTRTCKCGLNNSSLRLSRQGHHAFFCVCVCAYRVDVCVYGCLCERVHMCICVCHSPRQWWEVRGHMQPAFLTPGIYFDNNNNPPYFCPTQASSQRPSSGITGLGTHTYKSTHTHLLELQLYTTSQSNTSPLSKQHQDNPTTLHLRAEGFQVITHPPAAMLEVRNSWCTVTVERWYYIHMGDRLKTKKIKKMQRLWATMCCQNIRQCTFELILLEG